MRRSLSDAWKMALMQINPHPQDTEIGEFVYGDLCPSWRGNRKIIVRTAF
jgi:hypothetical protein